MSKRQVVTPVNIGDKLLNPLKGAQSVSIGGLRDSAEALFKAYKHRRGRFIDIDYKLDDEGRMQFHIFPRVPDHSQFFPNNQEFARALEASVLKVFGRAAHVEAEFQEEDGVTESYQDVKGDRGKPDVKVSMKKADTRVKAYHRRPDGELTHILFHKSVPMVWLCVTKVPGLMMPRDQALEILVDTFIQTTERLLPRA